VRGCVATRPNSTVRSLMTRSITGDKPVHVATSVFGICIYNASMTFHVECFRQWTKNELLNLIRERQAGQISNVLHGDTLLKDILEGRIKQKQQIGRPHCKTLDWMMNRDNRH